MPAPTFVASYTVPINTSASGYDTSTTPKTVSVTTLAGDMVVVYAGQENGGAAVLGTLSGNGITFTQRQTTHIDGSYSDAAVYTGTDTTGGTNWTLTLNSSSGVRWGFTCLVFRNSSGIGASAKANADSTTGSTLALTTTGDNSAVIIFNADWRSTDGASRVWRTVNGDTPSSGNGRETTYHWLNATSWTVYGAYHADVGTAGSKTVGLSAPTTQKYSIIAVEILGSTAGIPLMWYKAMP